MKAFSFELLHDRIEFIPMGLFKLDLQFLYNVSLIKDYELRRIINKMSFSVVWRGVSVLNNPNPIRYGTEHIDSEGIQSV